MSEDDNYCKFVATNVKTRKLYYYCPDCCYHDSLLVLLLNPPLRSIERNLSFRYKVEAKCRIQADDCRLEKKKQWCEK